MLHQQKVDLNDAHMQRSRCLKYETINEGPLSTWVNVGQVNVNASVGINSLSQWDCSDKSVLVLSINPWGGMPGWGHTLFWDVSTECLCFVGD